MTEADRVVLALRGITKRFPGVVANDAIDFDLRRGEVHALLGENGAGKSTLMNVLYGLYRPDEGEIVLNGKPITFHSPGDAIRAGIGMVHQHFMLIPVMTVAENIVLATEPRKAGVFLDYGAAETRVRALADQFGFAIDPDSNVEDISVGQQQRVEILKALYRRADVLILDEPTAVLTPQEATELFAILKSLNREGMSIIFITHKLNEVLEIANRITVLRRGRKIETVERRSDRGRPRSPHGGPRGAVQSREVDSEPGPGLRSTMSGQATTVASRRFADCRDRARGEIVDDGNGQSELVEVLSGLRRPTPVPSTSRGPTSPEPGEGDPRPRRRTHPGGSSATRSRPRLLPCGESRAARLRQATERPLRLALPIPSRCAREGTPPALRRPRRRSAPPRSREAISRRSCWPGRSAGSLALLAVQPTRGLDVGAIEFVHQQLVAARDAGEAVLLVSLELEEILSLSDRVLAIYEGKSSPSTDRTSRRKSSESR